MNTADKKKLASIIERIDKLIGPLEELHEELEALASDEQEKYDNMSDGLQQGERGQAIEEAASALEEMRSAVEQAKDALEEAKSQGESIE